MRKALLASGVLAVASYVGWHEIAALQWDGYSRVSNAISELHLTGAASKWVLDPWQGIVYAALLVPFGIGVWLSSGGKRSLRALGGLQMLGVAAFPLWVVFGEESVLVHTLLGLLSVVSWLGTLGLAAIALGGRFRLYTLATLVLVVAFFLPVFAYAPAVEAGAPTPYLGLFERLAFGAYFLWTVVLVLVLWRWVPPSGPRRTLCPI